MKNPKLAQQLEAIILAAADQQARLGTPPAVYYAAQARKAKGDLKRLLTEFVRLGPAAGKLTTAYVEEAIKDEINHDRTI